MKMPPAHLAILPLALLFSVHGNATLLFSDVSYTENSLTFTVDGDFSGYTTPSSSTNQFGIQYIGDIFSAPVVQGEYTTNSWTPGFVTGGNTGTYYNDQTVPYTWASITDNSPINQTITLTTGNYFNTMSTSGMINFVWGNGCYGDCNGTETLLASFAFMENPIDIPEPAGIALLGLGLFAIGARFRQSRR
uniref:PEP-CTERM sorting domain-containing protein n=1 Tax=Thaumasiovibrio occultus TaxID=1891184 RepID=UPI000B35787D|nr:PEP-CTERM sorting domain-containing protein [Thaumasiovibrio occultus]